MIEHGPCGPIDIRSSVGVARLHSDLVTRHTGRAVRLTIESRLAERDGPNLTVLDFRDVRLIDFSCADEVVAKLLVRPEGESVRDRFFLFRGMEEHHVDPVDSALRRRGLAAAAERTTGEPCLLGEADPEDVRVWTVLCGLGRGSATVVADGAGLPPERARRILDGLHARCLVLREERDFVALVRAAAEAGVLAGDR